MTATTYNITIHDLHCVENGVVCGGEAVVAILDNGIEIHRQRFIGKSLSPNGYTRKYQGKPGLEAVLLSGDCRMVFELSEPSKAAPVHP